MPAVSETRYGWLWWGVSPLLLGGVLLLSLAYGTKALTWGDIAQALLAFQPDNVNHQIVWSTRLPRALAALGIGAALGVSGALMQGMTRNYLASPGIMGVSDGSVLVVTLLLLWLPDSSPLVRMLLSFIGSAAGAALVFGIGAWVPHGLSPVRLALLGTIIGTFLSSVAAALALFFQITQDISFWYHSRLHLVTLEQVAWAAPFLLGGLGLAFYGRRDISILALGDTMAVSLGQRLTRVRLLGAAAVVLLTGSAVALAGKIAFVGLMVPHLTRFWSGSDYQRLIPGTALSGALFLGLADIGSRFLNYPFETPIGVLTSLLGVPFFLYLTRKRGGR